MKLSQKTLTALTTLRELKIDAKKVNKKVDTQMDVLTLNIIEDALELYVTDKKTFTSYNNFITLYNDELLREVDDNEKSLINIIAMVTLTLSKGLKNKAGIYHSRTSTHHRRHANLGRHRYGFHSGHLARS